MAGRVRDLTRTFLGRGRQGPPGDAHRGHAHVLHPPPADDVRGARTWAALAALLAACALIGALPGGTNPELLLWRRAAPAEAWRWFTPVAVHWDHPHLLANLAGAALVGLLGWNARLPRWAALAWALAWPLTHLGLWVDGPDSALQRYAGLSGVLHAGVTVAAVALVGDRRPASPWRWPRAAGLSTRQVLGLLVGAGLAAKIGREAPWQGALAHVEGWSFPVAVSAHASGAVAGAAVAALLCGVARHRAAPPPRP